jgi:HAD superfamily hydrolase (TIGR01509 family)
MCRSVSGTSSGGSKLARSTLRSKSELRSFDDPRACVYPVGAMSIGCVIFDCDGTLVDSELLSNVALSRALAALTIQESASELLSRYRGARMANILADLETRHALSLPATFEADYRRLVAGMFERELAAIEGVHAVLESLTVPVCVASSGPRLKIELALRVTKLAPFFADRIFSSYEIGSWKPEPQLFLHAARTMGFSTDDCVVVEDSLLGAQAAARAGMRCFLFDPRSEVASGEMFGAVPFARMCELPQLLR